MLESLYARPMSIHRSIAVEDATPLTVGAAGFGHLAFALPAPAAAGALVALALLAGSAAAKYRRERWA